MIRNTYYRVLTLLYILGMLTSLIGCKEKNDEAKPTLQIPQTYDSPNFTANTIVEQDLRLALQRFTAYLKKGDTVSNKLDLLNAEGLFVQGTPSLESITAPYYTNLIKTRWLPDLVASSGNTYNIRLGAANTGGGVQGTRLVNQGGKELLQEIEKGLYSAAFFRQITLIAQNNLNVNAVDRMLALYGAHPSFPNTNNVANTPYPDYAIALYAARRDKNDGKGLYTRIKQNFITLRAAVQAGDKYKSEQQQALNELYLNLEKALMATVINYNYAAIDKFSKTNPTDVDLGNALHDISESVGFIHGLKGVAQEYRKITDSQIHDLLALLNAPYNGPATMYKFYNSPTELAKLNTAIQTIKNIYGFTDDELNDFKRNWIADQGR